MRNNRQQSKSFSQIIQLRVAIENGLKCAVVTHNPEKYEKDFKSIAGTKLKLKIRNGEKDIYDAFIDECKKIPKVLVSYNPKGCNFVKELQEKLNERHSITLDQN